ncbi:MAG TPA: peptide-methionine (S)-S-oxide reductase MsrA [Candidatus Nanoarchaeia archaeon]|nr:peptide-methionine (S)-S-oxide reductase MsrA [Candidatus Nanoarchaeia archaeon]
MQKATFAAGCFWHVEAAFQNVTGVIATHVGYTGGTTKNPTYKEVCSDTTQHAEAVEIEFDENKISYKELLDIFWKSHDPTQHNRQGPDFGTQYRSAIFYHSAEQKNQAETSKKALQKTIKNTIATEIVKATEFYLAEEYHQKYFQKHGKVCGI